MAQDTAINIGLDELRPSAGPDFRAQQKGRRMNPVDIASGVVGGVLGGNDAAAQFAKLIDQAALSLGMQIFNQQQEAAAEFQQEH
jgi:hypothetical protein